MTYYVREIRHWRSVKRNPKTNESMFNTVWTNGVETTEPMSHFYDRKYYNEFMDKIVCDFIKTAVESPHVHRKCLTCRNDVHNGNVFCTRKNGIGKCANLRYRYRR